MNLKQLQHVNTPTLIARQYDRVFQDLKLFAAAQTTALYEISGRFPLFSMWAVFSIWRYDFSLGKPELTQGHKGGTDNTR
jgi:hypothetical protein